VIKERHRSTTLDHSSSTGSVDLEAEKLLLAIRAEPIDVRLGQPVTFACSQPKHQPTLDRFTDDRSVEHLATLDQCAAR
jgi:hypothetical protein